MLDANLKTSQRNRKILRLRCVSSDRGREFANTATCGYYDFRNPSLVHVPKTKKDKEIYCRFLMLKQQVTNTKIKKRRFSEARKVRSATRRSVVVAG